MRKVILAALVAACAALLVAPGGLGAKPGNSLNAKLCQKGGYQYLTSTGGTAPFASEAACVSYAASTGAGFKSLTLAVSPSSKDFGDVTIGGTAPSQTFTISNVGTQTALLTGIAPSFGGAFSATSNNCADVTSLAPNASCTVDIAATSTSPGAASGSWQMNYKVGTGASEVLGSVSLGVQANFVKTVLDRVYCAPAETFALGQCTYGSSFSPVYLDLIASSGPLGENPTGTFGLGEQQSGTLTAQVTCLQVTDNSAVFGGVIISGPFGAGGGFAVRVVDTSPQDLISIDFQIPVPAADTPNCGSTSSQGDRSVLTGDIVVEDN